MLGGIECEKMSTEVNTMNETKKLTEQLDLSNCLDLADKDNIQVEVQDDEKNHVTAFLWLWDDQYMEILNRSGMSERLNRTSYDIIFESDDIISVYVDVCESGINVTAIIDTATQYLDFPVTLSEQETESLKCCLETAMIEQFGQTLSETLANGLTERND